MSARAKLAAQIDRFERLLMDAIDSGLEDARGEIEGVAVATDRYTDDTGATRAGTVAVVAGRGDSGAARVRRAAAEVEAQNPGRSHVEDVPGPARGDRAIVLTVPSDYIDPLVTSNLGARDFLGTTIQSEAARAMETVERAVRQQLGG